MEETASAPIHEPTPPPPESEVVTAFQEVQPEVAPAQIEKLEPTEIISPPSPALVTATAEAVESIVPEPPPTRMPETVHEVVESPALLPQSSVPIALPEGMVMVETSAARAVTTVSADVNVEPRRSPRPRGEPISSVEEEQLVQIETRK